MPKHYANLPGKLTKVFKIFQNCLAKGSAKSNYGVLLFMIKFNKKIPPDSNI